LQDLALLIVQNHLLMQLVCGSNIWHSIHVPKRPFLKKKQVYQKLLLNLVEKTKQKYVLPK